MPDAWIPVLGKVIDWFLKRPSKRARQLERLKVEQEIASLRNREKLRAKSAAIERAVEHGMRIYREDVQRQRRRWLLTDEINQTKFANDYADEHWREFLEEG